MRSGARAPSNDRRNESARRLADRQRQARGGGSSQPSDSSSGGRSSAPLVVDASKGQVLEPVASSERNFSEAPKNFTPAPNSTDRFQPIASTNTPVAQNNQVLYAEVQRKQSNINDNNSPPPNDNARSARENPGSSNSDSSSVPSRQVPQSRVEAAPQKGFFQSRAEQYETKRLESAPRSPERLGYYALETGARLPGALREFADFTGNIGNPMPRQNTVVRSGLTLKDSLVNTDPVTGEKSFNFAPLNPLTAPARFVIEPFKNNPAKFTAQTAVDFGLPAVAGYLGPKVSAKVSPITADAVAIDSATTKVVAISDDVSLQAGLSKTKVSTNIGREFVVNTEVAGTLRKDFDGRFVGTQESQFFIEEISAKGKPVGEYRGAGRTDLQVTGTAQKSSFEGTYAQLVNGKRGGGTLQRGTVRGMQFEVEPGVSVGGQATSIGASTKVKAGDFVDLKDYVQDVGLQKKNSFGITLGEEVARVEQPLNVRAFSEADVNVGFQSKPVTQIIGRSQTETIGGKEQLGVLQRELNDGSVIFGIDEATGRVFGEVKKFDGVPTKPSSQVLEQLQRTDSPLSVPFDIGLQTKEAVIGLLQAERNAQLPKTGMIAGGLISVSAPKVLPGENRRVVTENVEPLIQMKPKEVSLGVQVVRKSEFVPVIRSEAVTRSDVDFTQKLGRLALTESLSRIKSKGRQDFATDVAAAEKSMQRAEQAAGQEFEQRLDSVSLTDFNQIRRPALVNFFEVPRVPVVPLLPSVPRGDRDVPLFFVVVGKKGNKVFEELGVGGSDLVERGRKLAKDSAAATVKVVPVNAAAQRVNVDGYFDSDTFRRGKEYGEFVQKREKRISSGGEKREITFEGVRASSRKRKGLLNDRFQFSSALDKVNSGVPLRKVRRGFF